ncbi:unnamed protein product, partial [Polarella glacialis]
EMVHTMALLSHRGDPRVQGPRAPRFFVSLSGAVNPGHFEAPGGGLCPPARLWPGQGELRTPCLFLGDFVTDGWYLPLRFTETLGLYANATLVSHSCRHKVPELSGDQAAVVRDFLLRFAAR